ncbi:MAG: DUF3284 domain-containing protein [Mycoplasmatales bacterium]
MAKLRKKKFNASQREVYDVIAQMLRDNGKEYSKKITNKTKLENIKYSYGKETTVSVEVTNIVDGELIEYYTEHNKAERFGVSFKVEQINNTTTLLSYTTEFINDSKKLQYNYMLMSLVYSIKQRNAFKRMCEYIKFKLEEGKK